MWLKLALVLISGTWLLSRYYGVEQIPIANPVIIARMDSLTWTVLKEYFKVSLIFPCPLRVFEFDYFSILMARPPSI